MPSKLPSILIGGITYAVIGAIAGFLAQMGGGMQFVAGALACLVAPIVGCGLAVWHYTTTHQLTIAAGQGAGLGAAAGILGGLVGWVLQQLFVAAGLLLGPAEQARRQVEAQGLSGEQAEQAVQFAETFSGPLGIVIGLVIAAVLGAIIGAIAAVIFKKGADDELVTEL
ncbi:MAG: hypothetical protein HKN04_03815 [Rhodothermaceae bacterium]|nr:hypothetical protein [Rhodothermaceae bacterium]